MQKILKSTEVDLPKGICVSQFRCHFVDFCFAFSNKMIFAYVHSLIGSYIFSNFKNDVSSPGAATIQNWYRCIIR